MTLYAFRCEHGHDIDRRFPLGTAPGSIHCEDHGTEARRLLARGAFTTIAGAHNATYRKS